MIRFIQVFFFAFAMSLATSALAYSDEQIAQTLKWEQKWTGVINRAIGKYTSKYKAILKGAEPAKRDKALRELTRYMRDRLSWQRRGKKFIGVLTQSCDKSTLNAMVDIKRGQKVPREKRKEIASQYKACAVPGYRKAMKSLASEIMGAKPQVDRIIAQARS